MEVGGKNPEVRSQRSEVRSRETGMYYSTAKKASIPSTFDEETCKSLIGQQLDGTVEKVVCEPYEFVSESTGEVIMLDHRWVFVKTGDSLEEVVKAEKKQLAHELV